MPQLPSMFEIMFNAHLLIFSDHANPNQPLLELLLCDATPEHLPASKNHPCHISKNKATNLQWGADKHSKLELLPRLLQMPLGINSMPGVELWPAVADYSQHCPSLLSHKLPSRGVHSGHPSTCQGDIGSLVFPSFPPYDDPAPLQHSGCADVASASVRASHPPPLRQAMPQMYTNQIASSYQPGVLGSSQARLELLTVPPSGMTDQSYALMNKRHMTKRRTRTGCLTCRKRHIKCDERKPHCFNCERLRRPCLGYAVLPSDTKRRDLNTTSTKLHWSSVHNYYRRWCYQLQFQYSALASWLPRLIWQLR